ncbi:sulfotransferase family protein [Candidatus Leptofilum sp.]|uniref:sulfotransferase family protein n=1 Tax=Candidatus Leptofilum sp. TaxID=3241576 RepID=UPI003B5B6045
MKVIGSGFGRTGTKSMKLALEQLGFGRCYHMEEALADAGHTETWYHISQGQSADWQQLFQAFGATVDFPGCVYYQELLETFPDAKVVHTVRDSESWYQSTYDTIYRGVKDKLFPSWLQRAVKRIGQLQGMVSNIIWDGVFEGEFENRQRAIEIFEQHTAEVKRTVPADKLLVFSVKEGWEPLCQFLDVPIPSIPFPHVNDRKSMLKTFRKLQFAVRAIPVALVASVVVVLATIIWVF